MLQFVKLKKNVLCDFILKTLQRNHFIVLETIMFIITKH